MIVRRLYGFAIGAAVVSLGLAACTSGADTAASSTASSASGATASSSAGSTTASSSAGATAPAGARIASIPGLDQSAIDVMNKPVYANGQWAIAVKDIDTGEQIIAYNDDLLFEPGSVVSVAPGMPLASLWSRLVKSTVPSGFVRPPIVRSP